MSALLTGRSDAPTARILDAMLRGGFPFLLSMELLREYRSVLLRPKIQKRHGLDESEIEVVLTELVVNARLRDPERLVLERRGDDHLWALLAFEPECVLVTGDRALAAAPRGRGRVLSPREFVARLE